MGCASLPIGAFSFRNIYSTADATTPEQFLFGIPGKTAVITDIVISTDTALKAWVEDDDNAVLIVDLYLPATSVWSKTWSSPIELTEGYSAYIASSVAGNISITVTGYYK